MGTTQKRIIDKQLSDKISFITYIVPAFAYAFKMNMQDAFLFLKQYGGWEYLNKHWWALHTDSTFWAVSDIYEICRKNGAPR